MVWQPRPHEVDLFHEVYIDETSQTGHRFLILGGIIFPRKYTDLFTEKIMEARLPQIPVRHPNGKRRQIGWREFAPSELDTYKRIVDAFHRFRSHFPLTSEKIEFHASIVDTHVQGRRYSGKAGERGFNREIYFHCIRLGRKFERELFHIYPDQRTTSQDPNRLRFMLNKGIKKGRPEENRDWPYRRLQSLVSHESLGIQVSDLFIGAIAYRLNGHYDKADANHERKELCDYILKRGGLLGMFRARRLKFKDYGNFKIWVRRHPK
jgi:hypothetical protein